MGNGLSCAQAVAVAACNLQIGRYVNACDKVFLTVILNKRFNGRIAADIFYCYGLCFRCRAESGNYLAGKRNAAAPLPASAVACKFSAVAVQLEAEQLVIAPHICRSIAPFCRHIINVVGKHPVFALAKLMHLRVATDRRDIVGSCPRHIVGCNIAVNVFNLNNVRVLGNHKRVARQRLAVKQIAVYRLALLLFRGKIYCIALEEFVGIQNNVFPCLYRCGSLGNRVHIGEIQLAVRDNALIVVEYYPYGHACDVVYAYILVVCNVHTAARARRIFSPYARRPDHFNPLALFYTCIVPPVRAHYNVAITLVIYPHFKLLVIGYVQQSGHVYRNIRLVILCRGNAVKLYFIAALGIAIGYICGNLGRKAALIAAFATADLSCAKLLVKIQHPVLYKLFGRVNLAAVFVVVGVADSVLNVYSNRIRALSVFYQKASIPYFHFRFGVIGSDMENLSPALFAHKIARNCVSGHLVGVAFYKERGQIALVIAYGGRGSVCKVNNNRYVAYVSFTGRINKLVNASVGNRYRLIAYVQRLAVRACSRFKINVIAGKNHPVLVNNVVIGYNIGAEVRFDSFGGGNAAVYAAAARSYRQTRSAYRKYRKHRYKSLSFT